MIRTRKRNNNSVDKVMELEVLKRDGYTCKHCGGHPPMVFLQAVRFRQFRGVITDHNTNYLTSCRNCTPPKFAASLPQTVEEKAEEYAFRAAQLAGYNEVLRAHADRIEDDAWRVVSVLRGKRTFILKYPENRVQTVKRFLEQIPVEDALKVAHEAKKQHRFLGGRRFKKFCRLAWDIVRDRL